MIDWIIFGWKVLLPLSIVVVFLTAVWIILVQQFGAVYIWFIPILPWLLFLLRHYW